MKWGGWGLPSRTLQPLWGPLGSWGTSHGPGPSGLSILPSQPPQQLPGSWSNYVWSFGNFLDFIFFLPEDSAEENSSKRRLMSVKPRAWEWRNLGQKWMPYLLYY